MENASSTWRKVDFCWRIIMCWSLAWLKQSLPQSIPTGNQEDLEESFQISIPYICGGLGTSLQLGYLLPMQQPVLQYFKLRFAKLLFILVQNFRQQCLLCSRCKALCKMLFNHSALSARFFQLSQITLQDALNKAPSQILSQTSASRSGTLRGGG